MDIRRAKLAGVDMVITRSGYTGEDGFEISLAADHAPDFAARIVANGKVTLGRAWRARHVADGGRPTVMGA